MSHSQHGLEDAGATVKSIGILPNEILAYIFTIGARSRPGPYDELPFPLLVSCITRSWRDVAINSPSVWSNLIFTTSVHSDRWCAALWLPRSGAHPLDITIDLLGRAKERIMNLIIPHVARWRRFSVKAWDRGDLEVVLLPLRTASAPLLQHVEFRCLVDEDAESWQPHEHCLTLDTTLLRSVRLRGLCMECAPPHIGLTAIQLDSHQTFLTYNQISDLLSASPGLKTLMLRWSRVDLPDDTNLPVIKLPSLRSLAMNFRACENSFVYLFALLSMPALESLELIGMSHTHTDDFTAYCMTHSVSPKYPNLRKLKLFSCGGAASDGVTFDEHMMDNFLAIFPTITSLYRVESKTRFITPPHFSLLKEITFSAILPEQIDWVRDEVQTRHSNAQPLSRIRVSRYTYSLNVHVWSRLRDLVEVVELDDDSDSLRYTGESDDEMGDDFGGEDPLAGYDDWSDGSIEDWEDDYEDEIEEDAWNSDD
ncbi:hypothetical protein PILCRDRAFT_91563 [Piloderma croceum F 1598]|uniref:F-box domain-containing protein n=1 Tax=Piloderma croceum (strain F 1598) TaxID=765440 RepID=A0A0C3AR98_PILCF|nr:hypothetical protein PILCRDRAFT_91563 [Piloderma croceum F 1598]